MASKSNPAGHSSLFLVSKPGLAPYGDLPMAENELNSNIWNNMCDIKAHRINTEGGKELHRERNEIEQYIRVQEEHIARRIMTYGFPASDSSFNVLAAGHSSLFLVSKPGLAPYGDLPTVENELNSNIWNNMCDIKAHRINTEGGKELHHERNEIEQYIRVQEEHVARRIMTYGFPASDSSFNVLGMSISSSCEEIIIERRNVADGLMIYT
eukprot:Gb_32734 [translate_table: standard]